MNCKRCNKKLTLKDLWLNRYQVCVLCSYRADKNINNRTIENYKKMRIESEVPRDKESRNRNKASASSRNDIIYKWLNKEKEK